jgi:hypothetical protein
LIIEAVDRVVQRRRVVAELNALRAEPGHEVAGAETYPRGKAITDAFFASS